MTIYLYVKQHSITGLKYFGRTERKDPEKYLGSGIYWKNHIHKYGKSNVDTIQLWEFYNQADCTEFALKFSAENNIVESKEWANQIPENGKATSREGLSLEPWNKGLTGAQVPWNKGILITEDYKNNISFGTKLGMSKIDKQTKKQYYKNRDSCNDRRWMNKDGIHKRIPKDQQMDYLNNGWSEGRLISRSTNGKFINKENI